MTSDGKVVLTRHDRKDRLGHGGIKAIADELNVDASLVSRVVNLKKRHDGIEAAIAKRVALRPDEVAFPPRDRRRVRAAS